MALAFRVDCVSGMRWLYYQTGIHQLPLMELEIVPVAAHAYLQHPDPGANAWELVVEEGFSVPALKLARNLASSESQVRIPPSTESILDQLNDQRLTGIGKKEFSFFENSSDKYLTPNHLASAAILFQAIYLFLLRSGASGCHRALLLSAWQWYNLIKTLIQFASNASVGKGVLDKLNVEHAEAYKSLSSLLVDAGYTAAMHWMAEQANWEEGWGKKTEVTLRERILRSLFLQEDNFDRLAHHVNLETPFSAPGMLGERLNWNMVRLHAAFTTPLGRREVLRFVHSSLLPNYDFRSALHFSSLLSMKSNDYLDEKPAYRRINRTIDKMVRRVLVSPPLLLAGAFSWYFFILVIGWGGSAFGGGCVLDSGCLPFINFLQIIILTLPLVVILTTLGWEAVGYLSLPRLVSGVIVGYLALILQDKPGVLSNIIWTGSSASQAVYSLNEIAKISLLWLLVLGLGFFFILFELRAVLMNKWLAFRRAGFVLGVAVLVSSVLGLVAITITTSASSPQLIEGNRYLLGPFGWVDFSQYLIYVPLAIFTGLVTQFIFEGKSLTAPVWSAEQPN